MTKLEVERAIARSIARHTAESLSCRHALTLSHRHTREVAIHRDVTAVAHNHIAHTSHREDSRHFTVKHTARLSTSTASEVNTLVVKRHTVEPIHVVSTKMTRNRVVARDWHWQTTLVGSKTARELRIAS